MTADRSIHANWDQQLLMNHHNFNGYEIGVNEPLKYNYSIVNTEL